MSVRENWPQSYSLNSSSLFQLGKQNFFHLSTLFLPFPNLNKRFSIHGYIFFFCWGDEKLQLTYWIFLLSFVLFLSFSVEKSEYLTIKEMPFWDAGQSCYANIKDSKCKMGFFCWNCSADKHVSSMQYPIGAPNSSLRWTDISIWDSTLIIISQLR